VRFSRRYGSDRRHAERIKKESPCVLHSKGLHLEAESTDFSHDGLGIKISAKTPTAVGDSVELSTSGLRIIAKIMWVRELPEKCLIGLQRIN